MKVYRYRRSIQVLAFLAFTAGVAYTFRPRGGLASILLVSTSPLVALTSLLHGTATIAALAGAVVLVSSFVLGRTFCGYVCPLGFLVEVFSSRRRVPPRTPAAWADTAPIVVAVVALIALAVGASFVLVLDPLSLLVRSLTFVVVPVVDLVVRLLANTAYAIPGLRPAVDGLLTASYGWVAYEKAPLFRLDLLALLMLVGILALSVYGSRFWCRTLCPLGSVLSLGARFSVFGRVVDPEACTHCKRCVSVCPMGAIGNDGETCDTSRCQLGFECAEACPNEAIGFGLTRRTRTRAPSIDRRTFLLAGTLAALASVLSVRASGLLRRRAIRPPGSQPEVDFLATCARCGLCMKSCPTNVIQPRVSGGITEIFTPELDFSLGYCEFTCAECGTVCPTGAIKALPLALKQRHVIGKAVIDRNRCIPWSKGHDCIVCQELCPVPDKAIVLEEREAASILPDAEPGTTVKLPYVVEGRCIGCGICENKCPAIGGAAITVVPVEKV